MRHINLKAVDQPLESNFLGSDEKAMADAKQGWRVDNTIRVARATRDLDFILEQPCQTYEEYQQVRRIAEQPMKLYECVTGIHLVQRIVADRSAEICCLKNSNLGGMSKARRVRDYLIDNRISVIADIHGLAKLSQPPCPTLQHQHQPNVFKIPPI